MPHIRPVTGPTKLCPECRVEGDRVELSFTGGSRTDWYGVLRYYVCKRCGERFVTINNKAPDIAA